MPKPVTDPLKREENIDILLERIVLADDIERARGYARQIQQLRRQIQQEIAEIIEELYLG